MTAFASSAAVSLRPAHALFTAVQPALAPARARVARRPRHARMVAEEPSKPGRSQKVQDFTKLYGGSYLGTSLVLSLLSFVSWYFLIKSGVNVVGLIQGLGDWLATTPIGRPAVLSRINETVGAATLAYIAHKASSPLRFPLTLAATPFVARVFSKKREGKTKE